MNYVPDSTQCRSRRFSSEMQGIVGALLRSHHLTNKWQVLCPAGHLWGIWHAWGSPVRCWTLLQLLPLQLQVQPSCWAPLLLHLLCALVQSS